MCRTVCKMIKRRVYLKWGGFIAAAVLSGTAFFPGAAMAQAFAPDSGRTMVVIGQNKQEMEGYIDAFGHVPAGFMTYTSIQNIDGLDEPAIDRGAGIHFAGHFVQRFPQTVLQIGLYMVDALDDVLSGAYDEHIARLGDWIKRTRRPVYLRIGYEFDFPDNRYDPENYQEAFRRIVRRLRADGVDNAVFVWHSYGHVDSNRPIMQWYPGDEYVDWFGLSFFGAFNEGSRDIIARLARDHGKPLMLAESTPFGIGVLQGERSWDIWFRRYFDFIEKWDVKMLCYISSDWEAQPMFSGQGWGNGRLHTNDVIRTRWMEKMREPRFLLSSQELFEQIGFKLPTKESTDGVFEQSGL